MPPGSRTPCTWPVCTSGEATPAPARSSRAPWTFQDRSAGCGVRWPAHEGRWRIRGSVRGQLRNRGACACAAGPLALESSLSVRMSAAGEAPESVWGPSWGRPPHPSRGATWSSPTGAAKALRRPARRLDRAAPNVLPFHGSLCSCPSRVPSLPWQRRVLAAGGAERRPDTGAWKPRPVRLALTPTGPAGPPSWSPRPRCPRARSSVLASPRTRPLWRVKKPTLGSKRRRKASAPCLPVRGRMEGGPRAASGVRGLGVLAGSAGAHVRGQVLCVSRLSPQRAPCPQRVPPLPGDCSGTAEPRVSTAAVTGKPRARVRGGRGSRPRVEPSGRKPLPRPRRTPAPPRRAGPRKQKRFGRGCPGRRPVARPGVAVGRGGGDRREAAPRSQGSPAP